MNGGQKSRAGEVELRKQAQLLQEDRPLAPRAAFGDGPTMEVRGHRLFVASVDGGGGHVGASEKATPRRDLTVDRMGDEPGVKGVEGAFDRLLLRDPAVGRSQLGIAKFLPRLRDAVSQIDRGGARPFLAKTGLDGPDRFRDSGQQWKARFGVT